MSNDIQKADQIAYRFYGKLILVVHHARATAEPPSNSANTKVDKWVRIVSADSRRGPQLTSVVVQPRDSRGRCLQGTYASLQVHFVDPAAFV